VREYKEPDDELEKRLDKLLDSVCTPDSLSPRHMQIERTFFAAGFRDARIIEAYIVLGERLIHYKNALPMPWRKIDFDLPCVYPHWPFNYVVERLGNPTVPVATRYAGYVLEKCQNLAERSIHDLYFFTIAAFFARLSFVARKSDCFFEVLHGDMKKSFRSAEIAITNAVRLKQAWVSGDFLPTLEDYISFGSKEPLFGDG